MISGLFLVDKIFGVFNGPRLSVAQNYWFALVNLHVPARFL